MKVFEKIKENKIFFILFGFITFTSVIYLSEKSFIGIIDNEYYPLYAVNYNCGFSSRLFVGSIFSLFFKNSISITAITSVLLALYFVICFCISLFINNYIKNSEYNKSIGIYIACMVMSPVFLALLRYLGTTDIFWLFFVLACIYAADKKYLRWFIPVFCVISLAIHEVFLITYLPMIALIVLYKTLTNPDKIDILFLVFCVLIIGAGAVYFAFIGDNTMKMSSDEFIEYAANRLNLEGTQFSDFYARSVFFWDAPKSDEYIGFLGYLKYNLENFVFGESGALYKIITHISLPLLMAIPFFSLMKYSMKEEQNKCKKFIFFCTLFLFFPTIILLFFSTDTERYSLHFIMNIIFLLGFFTKENDEAFTKSCKMLTTKIKNNKITYIAVTIPALILIL